ncbi:unnamed protein product [Agarophyton chilense]|eukprot:gb/GEZJ01007946.1/.p2 GENE.gb/GEZJ01007946.1/~~gb/GEZJ01007946.1/.p2  ORF type:complete len:102 (-),score=7.05 gb/GEZJ01007946.1/:876-1181(-)
MIVLYADRVLFAFMDFSQAAHDKVVTFTHSADARLHHAVGGEESKYDRLLPFSYPVVCILDDMGLENILRSSSFPPNDAETLLKYVLEIYWAQTQGSLWYG